MPSKEEKKRRRALVRSMQEREIAKAVAQMPISKVILRQLLLHLDKTVFTTGPDGNIVSSCDHTLRETQAYLTSHGVWSEAVPKWLAEYGGYCDCEVSFNVGEYWEDKL